MFRDVISNFVIGIVFIVAGAIMILIPNRIFSLILNISIILLVINAIVLFIRFIREHNKGDFLFFILAILFAGFLCSHVYWPQWLIRVLFATYLLLNAISSLIQLLINYINDSEGKFFFFILIFVNGYLGLYLLFHENFDSDYLLQFFGIYFIVLGSRYLNDGFIGVNPLVKYQWKRKVRITLPAFLCAFFPDWALNSINHYLSSGKPVDLEKKANDTNETILKVMVHVGPYGFQKVGHISFSYKGIVYSYGNYDSDSFRFNQTIGDGVFFKVPIEYYIPNALEAENNSIFEYGIQIDEDQKPLIENALKQIENNSYRWYSKIEKSDGYFHFEQFKDDYPSRLHYKTGAKFYKIKTGKFKTYWALGDNCALFTDSVLGELGTAVLSMRGIISPGTYLDYLQNEYLKKNSPVISLSIHSRTKT